MPGDTTVSKFSPFLFNNNTLDSIKKTKRERGRVWVSKRCRKYDSPPDYYYGMNLLIAIYTSILISNEVL